MFRRFVGDPKFGAVHRQRGDHFSLVIVDAEQFDGPERRLVELDRTGTLANREHRRDGGFGMIGNAHIS